jgi:hypothetical protein
LSRIRQNGCHSLRLANPQSGLVKYITAASRHSFISRR